MSYVELKHLLAALTLQAIHDPGRASWVAVAAVCAEHASLDHGGLSRSDCLAHAALVAAPLGWRPQPQDITHLEQTGLLIPDGDFIRLSPRFAPHRAYAHRQTARLLEALNALQEMSEIETAEDAVRVAAALFNAALFFECHEWGEALWRKAAGAARDFYHGLVQVAAAFYHYEKGSLHGSHTLLAKGCKKLAPFPRTYLGINLEQLRAALAPWAEHFSGGPRPAGFPHLVVAPKAKGAPRG